jgi:2-phosphoglycolate phosphatase
MTALALLDLDGTLADTAADLGGALNELRAARGLAPLPLAPLLPAIGIGTPAMLLAGLGIAPDHADFAATRDDFLARYLARIARETVLFPGIEDLLDTLETSGIEWGVVTNKPARFADPLLEALGLTPRAVCVVSGDTLPERKPHPAPLWHAAGIAGRNPDETVYLGDAETDIQAARAAGMAAVVAGWGYIAPDVDPQDWRPDMIAPEPRQFANWVLARRAAR